MHETYSQCATCNFWGPKNKKWTDGKFYCPIHIQVQKEKKTNANHAEKAKKNLEFVRKVIDVTPETIGN